MEIFFRPLLAEEIGRVAHQAMERIGFDHEPAAVEVIKKYATNGREAVNMVQTAAGLALTEGEKEIKASDVEWVVHSSQLTPRPDKKVPEKAQPGLVNGLAIHGPNMGILLEIEVTAVPAGPGQKRFHSDQRAGGRRGIGRTATHSSQKKYGSQLGGQCADRFGPN